MKDIAIKAQGLSKKYSLGAERFFYDNFRDRLAEIFKQPRHKGLDIWALKDVSFEVVRGSITGVIGRNGAGKSTLLKILSRITRPTNGTAKIHGRVASLLEVGTGFHEELTGFENIYFNGAILGMKKTEIDRNLEKIVDFAQIGRFLNTPIKHYSSGMAVRLAFSIAAHLEVDILLIDEVLAVGDINFQKKCFQKMSGIIKEGKTVLFVSHNMSAVNSLCDSAVLLDDGRLASLGDKKSVIDKYVESAREISGIRLSERIDRQGNGMLRFEECWLEDGNKTPLKTFYSGGNAVIAVRYKVSPGVKLRNISVAFAVHDNLGSPITDMASRISAVAWPEIPKEGVMRCHIPKLPFVPGTYTFNAFAEANGIVVDFVQSAGSFDVEAGDFFAGARLPDPGHGNILIEHSWSIG